MYTIVCNNYLTKWAKNKVVKVEREVKVDDLLMENAFYKFGYPRELVTNQGAQFILHLIENFFG